MKVCELIEILQKFNSEYDAKFSGYASSEYGEFIELDGDVNYDSIHADDDEKEVRLYL